MEFQIYEFQANENGNSKTAHRIYFGDSPKFISESAGWKLVYSELRESPYSPRETGNMFLEQAKLKPNYLDQNSGASRFGIGFSDLEKLSVISCLREFLMTNSEELGHDPQNPTHDIGGMKLHGFNVSSLGK